MSRTLLLSLLFVPDTIVSPPCPGHCCLSSMSRTLLSFLNVTDTVVVTSLCPGHNCCHFSLSRTLLLSLLFVPDLLSRLKCKFEWNIVSSVQSHLPMERGGRQHRGRRRHPGRGTRSFPSSFRHSSEGRGRANPPRRHPDASPRRAPFEAQPDVSVSDEGEWPRRRRLSPA